MDDGEDEIMEIDQESPQTHVRTQPHVRTQVGSSVSSPQSQSQSQSPNLHSSSPIKSPKLMEKSHEKSHESDAAGPHRQELKSPIKSHSRAASPTKDVDFFEFVKYPKISPQPKPTASSPPVISRNTEARLVPAEKTVIQQVASHPDRLLWEQQAIVFENQLVDLSSQLKTLQAEKKELADKYMNQSQEAVAMKKQLKEKDATLEKVLSEKQTSSLKSVQQDHDRQVIACLLQDGAYL